MIERSVTISDLVMRLVAAGAGPIVAASIVAEAFALGAMSGTSPGQVRDTAREYERARKSAWRANRNKINGSAEANDAAEHVAKGQPMSRTVPDICSVETIKESVSLSEGRDSKPRARGTRLPSDATISAQDFQFAREAGMLPAEIAQAWAEFRDYWIGVPGQRGTKLDWPATWRNRVRDIGKRGKGRPSPRGGGGMAAVLAKLQEAESNEQPSFDDFAGTTIDAVPDLGEPADREPRGLVARRAGD